MAKHGEDAVATTAKAGYTAAAGVLTPLSSGLGQGVSALGGGLGSGIGSIGKGVGGMFGDFGMMLPIAAVGLGGVYLMSQKKGEDPMKKMQEMKLLMGKKRQRTG